MITKNEKNKKDIFSSSRRTRWRRFFLLFFPFCLLPSAFCLSFAFAGTVPAEIITAAVENAVMEYARAHDLDVEITVPHAREVEIIGCDSPEIRAMLAAREIRGAMSPVRIEFRNGGGDLLKRAHFVAHVKTYAEAVVALRDIARGDSLKPENLAVKRVEVSGVKDYFSAPEELDGVCARLTIKSGDILRAGTLRPVPLIRRGDRVVIKAVVGSVELASEGIARQDGGRGESIRVYSEMTKTSVVGRVLDAKTVLAGKEGK